VQGLALLARAVLQGGVVNTAVLEQAEESQRVTEEELRMALLAMCQIERFVRRDVEGLIEATLTSQPSTRLVAQMAKAALERILQARKKDPVEWLGPDNVPGNPEYAQRYKTAKRILEKAEQAQDGHRGTVTP
jgi:hypothetical protein